MKIKILSKLLLCETIPFHILCFSTELSTENTSQESTLLYASSHCFWMILHVIYIAVIIASLVLCFCMFVGNPERQLDTDEKERVRDAIVS